MRLAGLLCLLALAPVALAATGCGGESATSSTSAAATPRSATYLPAADVDRVLGNSFRAGLQRLGAMQQPFDQGVDRGQPVPTGQLRAVDCAAAGARPTTGTWHWGCTVRWATTYGRSVRTAYDVGLSDDGCLGAAATPARPQVRDATAGTFSEDPLNALFGVRAGC